MSIVFSRGTFSWPLFLVFLVFFLPFCWQLTKTLRAIFFFEKTTGMVQTSDYVPPSLSRDASSPASQVGTYTHQVFFQALDGKTYQVFTRVKSNPPSLEVGESVPVYYNPANPFKALIGGFVELWFPPLALGFFVVIFFVLWFGTWVGSPPPRSSFTA